MPVLITTDSGRSVDVADPANAQVVADAFDRLSLRATTAEASAQASKAVADAHAEKLEAATKLSSDEAIKARVVAIGAHLALGRKIAGATFSCDSVDTIEIMRAAMMIKRPSVDWADKSAAYVMAAADMAAEEPDEDDKDGKKKTETGDMATVFAQLTRLAADAAGKTEQAAKPTVDAYSAYKESQSNAWKGK